MAMLCLRLYGPPRADRPDGESVPLAAREAALFARLHLDGPAPRAALAGWLWPQAAEARARANLRQTLLRIKQALGAPFDERDGMLALADSVEVAAGDGPLLGPLEFDDAPELADWLAEHRARVQRQRLREGLQAARAHLQAARLDQALASADAVLADDPAVEEAHRLRMQVFLQRGDRAAAITAWDDCRDALRRAYGITPSAATNALGRRILAASTAAAPSTDTAQPLVGRGRELDAIAAALAEGRSVLIVGPPGIGKSALLDAALPPSSAADGSVLRVAARAGDAYLPGRLMLRMLSALQAMHAPALAAATRRELRALMPQWHAVQPPPGREAAAPASALEYRRLLATLARLWHRARAQGLALCVVDDLHEADDLSLDALAAVVDAELAQQATGLQFVFGCRDGVARPKLDALFARLGERCLRVAPGPLDQQPVEDLIAARAAGAAWLQQPATRSALAQRLLRHVGGNPAMLLDALLHLQRSHDPASAAPPWQPGVELPLPPTLRDAVAQRLEQLAPDALRLAQLTAVAGADASLKLAAAALGRAPLELTPLYELLERSGVLGADGFAHDWVAEAVAAGIPASLRAQLHALVAEHLEREGGAAAAIARHRQAAGDRADAAAWHLRAAIQARAQWQLRDAALSFEAAAQCLDVDRARPRRLLALRDAARCWLNAGQNERARALLDAAAPLVRDERERVELQAARLTWSLNAGQHAELASLSRWLAQVLPRHTALLDDDELAHMLMGVASAAPYVAEPEALLERIAGLRPRAAAAPWLAARVEFAAGMVLNWMARPAEAEDCLQRADAIAAASGFEGERVNIANQRARSAEQRGDLKAASLHCLQTRRLARAIGAGALFEADALNLQALYEAAQGDGEAARAALDEAGRLWADDGAPSGYMRIRQALALLHLGEIEQAEAQLRALPQPAGDERHGVFGAFACWAWAGVDAARGRPAAVWLDRAQPACMGAESWMGLRQRVLRHIHRTAAAGDDAAELLRTLDARGLAGLAASLARALRRDAPATAGDPWCPDARRG
jgi:DNA-binding SARP family transcriptional activator